LEARPRLRIQSEIHRGARVSPRTVWRVFWGRCPAAVALAMLSTIIVCRLSPYLSASEFSLLYTLLALRPVGQPDPRIALVGLEKEAIDEFTEQRPEGCSCHAIPRKEIGEAISRIKRAGASVVVLDLELDEVCAYGQGTSEAHDQPLVDALDLPGETILTAEANATPEKLYFDDPPAAFVGVSDNPRIIASPVLYNAHGVVRGVSLVQTGSPSTVEEGSPWTS